MPALNLSTGFFAIPDPIRLLERVFNGFGHQGTVELDACQVTVCWTGRANRELQRRSNPLVVELQLYFSCVVKKRVLFHEITALAGTPVTDDLRLIFRAVASAACDPLKFVASYPQGKVLSNEAVARMVPRRVELDYRRGNWEGCFYY